MIQLANEHTSLAVRQMWKTCFDDSEEFMDLYFSEKYQNENTLIRFENNRAVASLQMLPYRFVFYDTEISVAYISGACTLPEFRKRGYMTELMTAAFEVMKQRNIPLSILIPAEKWLYNYYAKLGYEQVFDADETEIPLKNILDQANGDLDVAYSLFNQSFNEKDFCIRKTKSDFLTIVKDAQLDNFPPKTNLAGMARIIDAEYLISRYKQKYPNSSFRFEKIDINLLCRLLFGYHLELLPQELSRNFEPHQPILNLMLE